MVLTGRPRAHSASSIKFNQVVGSSCSISARGNLSYSSPELRSMLVGLETTVPQNLNPQEFASRHKPRRVRRRKMGSRASLARESACCCRCCGSGCCGSKCCYGGSGGGDDESGSGRDGGGCCRVHIFLVFMQLVLGGGVTALSVYLYLFLPVLPVRETPFWAGAPLCGSGLLGIYFCAINFKSFSKTTRAFVLKVLCSFLSSISVFVCIIAAIFIAIHLGRIFSYVSCKQSLGACHCHLQPEDSLVRVLTYPGLPDCYLVFCEVKIYLLVVGSLCLAGSLVSLWFLILLWKARYGRFYSGVRLPSVRRKAPEDV